MIPLITYPLALVAIAALPALVAIYFFRNRFRRLPVSSLMLWSRVLRPREGGPRVQRLVAPLSLLLEALTVFFLVLAAADPRWATVSSRRPLIFVLDDSASMSASHKGRTVRDAAMKKILDLCGRPDTGAVKLILAGRSPAVLDPGRRGLSGIRSLLDRWTCLSPEACIDRAVALAVETGRDRSRIVVITDHKPPPQLESGSFLWLAFGKQGRNSGIVNASRSVSAGRDRCMIEVANGSPGPITATLKVQTGNTSGAAESIAMQTGEVKRLVFDVPPGTAEVRAGLDGDDLAADNEVVLLPPESGIVRVSTLFGDPVLRALVDRALEASGMQNHDLSQTPDVFLTDAQGAIDRERHTWVVQFIGGDQRASYSGPYVADSGHPLMKGISLDGVVWGAGSTNRLPGTPVLTVGNLPILTDTRFPSGGHEVRMRFNHSSATLQDNPAWPVFFWNLLAWRRAELPGPSEVNSRLGADVTLSPGDVTTQVTVTAPDGARAQFTPSGASMTLDAGSPGVYKVEAGSRRWSFARNLLAPDETDMRDLSEGEWGAWADAVTLRRDYASSAWLFLLLALGSMTIHSMLLRRQGRVT